MFIFVMKLYVPPVRHLPQCLTVKRQINSVGLANIRTCVISMRCGLALLIRDQYDPSVGFFGLRNYLNLFVENEDRRIYITRTGGQKQTREEIYHVMKLQQLLHGQKASILKINL